MRVSLGDADLVVELRVPGLRAPQVLWHFGPVSDRPRPLPPAPVGTHLPYVSLKGVQIVATIKADQTAEFSIGGVDEAKNPVPLDGEPPVFALDSTDVVTLTVNPDGFGGAVTATGTLGTANLSVKGTTASGLEYSGLAAIEVVAGDVAGVAFTFGEPAEATPDV